MNITGAHLYTQSIFLSALVAHESETYIQAKLDKFYPYHVDAAVHRTDTSSTLMVDHRNCRMFAHNGTQNAKDWIVNNGNAFAGSIAHRGALKEFSEKVQPFVSSLSDTVKPIFHFGHSQGDFHAKMSVLDSCDADVEAVGFCGARWFTREGVRRFKANHCRVTDIEMPGDVVGKVGAIVIQKKPPFITFGERFGYYVKLPKVENDVIMGHAWSHVMRSLRRLYEIWGIPEQKKYIDAIMEVCKK